jgi:bifunctional DNA-binding transcriptional regulator/antitoxin component of YhaV-PrlF toxin-antitoxin module
MTDPTPATKMVRVLRNGRITIPAEFRRALAIDDDMTYQVTLADGELFIKPIRVQEERMASVVQSAEVDTRPD